MQATGITRVSLDLVELNLGIWEMQQKTPDLPRPLRLLEIKGAQDGDVKSCKKPHEAIGTTCRCILAVLCARQQLMHGLSKTNRDSDRYDRCCEESGRSNMGCSLQPAVKKKQRFDGGRGGRPWWKLVGGVRALKSRIIH